MHHACVYQSQFCQLCTYMYASSIHQSCIYQPRPLQVCTYMYASSMHLPTAYLPIMHIHACITYAPLMHLPRAVLSFMHTHVCIKHAYDNRRSSIITNNHSSHMRVYIRMYTVSFESHTYMYESSMYIPIAVLAIMHIHVCIMCAPIMHT